MKWTNLQENKHQLARWEGKEGDRKVILTKSESGYFGYEFEGHSALFVNHLFHFKPNRFVLDLKEAKKRAALLFTTEPIEFD